MGKVRVKTIGIEEDEKEQKKKAAQRAEKKRIEAAKKEGQRKKDIQFEKEKTATTETQGDNETQKDALSTSGKFSDSVVAGETSSDSNQQIDKKTKKEKFKKAKTHSKSYKENLTKVDKSKKYTLKEAIELLKDLKRAKFDEAVELHINTHEKGVSGSLTLPHGSGKKTKIEIADHTKDPKKVEELVKKIESGNIDFDILIATPESMSHLARVARFLGPRGLMPNPKSGTVHPKPDEAAKKFEGGQINFKTEPKAPIIHINVGKLSFEEKQLTENIEALLRAVQSKNIKNVTLKSTMSPGIKLAV